MTNAPDKSKRRILLVDDNASIHEDFKHILNAGPARLDDAKQILERELFDDVPADTLSAGPMYQIDDAFQGDDAIAMVDEAESEGFPYSVIFMDVRMPPGIDGIQTTGLIWKRHPFVEVVICTAHSDYAWEDILKALGSTDHLLFIHKPFDSVTIKQTAQTLCAKWDLDLQNRNYISHLEARIRERTRDLELLVKEKETYIELIRDEMTLAEIVQRQLLPADIPTLTDIRIAAHFIPTEKIGGDLYDIVPLEDGRIAFLIFDVSGHGIAAALVATIAKFSFRQHLHGAVEPHDVLTLVNKDIFASTPLDMYISAFLMIYSPATREALFSGAGHPAPLLVRLSTGAVEKLILPGLFLGVNDSTGYGSRPVAFSKGDMIVLYTDGLIETSDPEENLYGRERLIRLIQENPGLSCDDLLQRILLDNESYRRNHPRNDDLCMVGVEMR
jgi:serine phosphatase RsbU (regulator of sigma subunit)